MSRTKPKHHELPRIYLLGFCKDRSYGNPSLWTFERGHPFNPGTKCGNNPRSLSIGKTALRKDGYRVVEHDGRTHYEYEGKLQREEHKIDLILSKIRHCESIDHNEKGLFSSYIWLTYRRLTHHDKVLSDLLDKELEKPGQPSIVLQLAYAGRFAEAKRLLAYYDFLKSKRGREKLFREYMMKEYELLTPELNRMKWSFLVSPPSCHFITSDNPIIFDKNSGLHRSPLLFPIGHSILLVANHTPGIDLSYDQANQTEVLKINALIASNAINQVYSSTPDKWIYDGLENGFTIFPEGMST